MQVGEASFSGWISGSAMGGGYAMIQNIADKVQKNQQAYNLYGKSQQELVSEALELNPSNSYAQKLQGKLDSNKQLSGAQLRKLVAQNESVIQNNDLQSTQPNQMDKVSQKPTARNVGQLNATVQTATNQTNTSINPADVAESLKGKAIPSWKIDTLAEAIVGRVNDQKLTRTQREILSFEQTRSSVQNILSNLIQKKSNGVDNTQNDVYDKGNIGDWRSNEEKSASWNVSNLEVPPAAQQWELTSNADAFEDASVAEDSSSYQAQNVSSKVNDDSDIKSGRVLGNGQTIDDMAELYAEKVHSNRKWRWKDAFSNAGKLSKRDKSSIRKHAIEKGLIPDVPVKTVKASSKKVYRYANFEAAGLVKEKIRLPESLWSETDRVQFKWLDEKIGGRPKGYTWHHSEIDGQMELVPMGVHRVYHHNGGRTINHWAYRKGGR